MTIDIVHLIGTLDRCLSELKIAAKDPDTDEADRQTIKHHAEDCILLGNHVLKLLGTDHIPQDVLHGHLFATKEETTAPLDLTEVLRGYEEGTWVVLNDDRTKVVASNDDPAKARLAGIDFPNTLLIQVPSKHPTKDCPTGECSVCRAYLERSQR